MTDTNNKQTERLIFKLVTLGCRVNRYESDAISQGLQSYGWEDHDLIEDNESLPDVYVINTCGVTKEAARKSRQMVHKCLKANPKAYVVAVGCQIDLAHDTLGAHLGISNNDKAKAAQIVYTQYKDFLAQNGTEYPKHLLPRRQAACTFSDFGIVKQQSETRAFIKIQDGCQLNCSYCAIPLARGPVRSRPLDVIVDEAKALLANGFKEIVLTGIHISSYGLDLRKQVENVSLIDVMRAIDNLPNIERLRLGSLEPRLITAKFVEQIATLKHLTPHFHLSLQSGSDSVLRRMRRRYTTREYSKAIDLLKNLYPELNLTTDIIAGFPGESLEEHQASMRYVEEKGFTHLHVFPFSQREGTLANTMPNQLDNSLKRARTKEFIKLNNMLWRKRANLEIGRQHEVLLESKIAKEDALTAEQQKFFGLENVFAEVSGYTYNYLPVRLFFTDEEQFRQCHCNDLVKVEIFSHDGDDLFAKLL
ncbi:tRNA (N(6)-L-threonylcarbamoyladenosine(37)-C(2))-methylthiotransferase MtaB [Amygdalobacter nucleatus]|uniref:tRNA (N(6)-L-threonylcarbamoyladenosine(37)-C(2))- methylthiotransferase MtaB n=1 Tax=Amygdalobacter nucleatus TaxID=3029274 RepID=UPI0027A75E96|nr:tRNA (N(6)-L-threonylcarbamoyladenosine(37)-C(2))-methylthiotransferase MtaB [Amygdalobacter nucleatus]WEG36542.1 tRNA (N(6)-L-threonylcarbamoyladenosine(37)-C(2))-methylthiotransferase MtaB [Amygdalobacter nucleatus]